MNKEELLKAIMKLPKEKPNIPITTMNSINVDDLISAVDRLNEVPNYNDLLKENKQLKDNWNKLREWLKEYEEGTYGLGSYETGLSDGLGDVIKKMRELQGSDD